MFCSIKCKTRASTSQPLVDLNAFHASSGTSSPNNWSSWFSSDLSLEIELSGIQLLRSVSILVTRQNTIQGVCDFAYTLLTTSQPIVIFCGNESSSSVVINSKIEFPFVYVSSFAPPSTTSRKASDLESWSSAGSARMSSTSKKSSLRKRSSRLGKMDKENDSGTMVFPISDLDRATGQLMAVLQKEVSESVAIMATDHERVLSQLIDWSYSMSRDLQLTIKQLNFVKHKSHDMYKQLRLVILDVVPTVVSHCLHRFQINIHDRIANKTSTEKITCDSILQELALEIESCLAFETASIYTSYIETLFRCISNLENVAGIQGVANALDEMTSISQHLNIPVETGSSGFKRFTVAFKKKLLKNTPAEDVETQLTLDSLSAISHSKLSSHISEEMLHRLDKTYDDFVNCLGKLISAEEGRLTRSDALRCRIRRNFAPKVASLYLESISLRDLISFGRPAVGRELGRGQYGVVYSCEKWGPFKRLAVKSVVPADERHWGELALELYHARHIPEHPNLLTLRGSLIGYSNIDDADNRLTAVLVVTDRMSNDLHVAMQRGGLSWAARLVITIDICDALRFLHNRGLIHRDVKLKNVLLDSRNRARLADFGFCQPAALIAGSIVGTPIHMAPELLDNHFQSTRGTTGLTSTPFNSFSAKDSPDLMPAIDVYAFGIVLWYVCSGQTRLPKNFRDYDNRETLWAAVRRGIRPERLPNFSNAQWELMEQCWHQDPAKRPHIGTVHMVLSEMLKDLAQPIAKPDSLSDSLDFGEYN